MSKRKKDSQPQEEEEAVAMVVDDEDDSAPPRGEGSLGFAEEEEDGEIHQVEYYRAVVWRGERFEVGDCVSIELDEKIKGREKNERYIGQIIHLWERVDEDEKDEGGKQDDGRGLRAEVRRFMEPWELEKEKKDKKNKKGHSGPGEEEKRLQCGPGEVFESDRVVDVSVKTFDYKVDVYFKWKAWNEADPDFEAYWASRHVSWKSKNAVYDLVLGRPKDRALGRRLRSLSYSVRRGPREEELQGMEEGGQMNAMAAGKDNGKGGGGVEEEKESWSGRGGGESSGGKKGVVIETFEQGKKTTKVVDGREAMLLAQERLSLSAEPYGDQLPGRDQDLARIKNFINWGIRGGAKKDADRTDTGQQRGMYISGLPGTGKTATVRQAIKDLRNQGMGTTRFTDVEINAMRLSSPNLLYQLLWQGMNPKEGALSANSANQLLKKYFAGRGAGGVGVKQVTHAVVLLLDEMDCMMTPGGQSVLYSLFDWAGCVNSPRRLVFIGLGNTVNLPERLPPRIRSRLGTERLVFHTYGVEEMEVILEARLKGLPSELVTKTGIALCARQASAQCGDLRRAFQVLTVAIQIALEKAKTQVDLEDINQAALQFQRSVPVQFLQRTELSTYLQALCLVAVVGQIYAQGLGLAVESSYLNPNVGVTLRDVRSRLDDILVRVRSRVQRDHDDDDDDDGQGERKRRKKAEDLGLFLPSLPTLGELREMCERMAATGLIIMSQSKDAGEVRVRLGIQPADLAHALKLRRQAEKKRVGNNSSSNSSGGVGGEIEGLMEEDLRPEESPPPYDFLPVNLKTK